MEIYSRVDSQLVKAGCGCIGLKVLEILKLARPWPSWSKTKPTLPLLQITHLEVQVCPSRGNSSYFKLCFPYCIGFMCKYTLCFIAPVSATTPSPPSPIDSPSPGSSFPPYAPLSFPALSPTITSGTIIEWNVKEGQLISPGDVLCSVETDKSKMEWESQEDGYIAKILIPDGTSDIEVGAPCAILVEDQV